MEENIEVEDVDVVIFRGGKNSNRWLISLSWRRRQILRIIGAMFAGIISDSVFRNVFEIFQSYQISEQQLRLSFVALIIVIFIYVSIVYAKNIRIKVALEDDCAMLKEMLSTVKDTVLTKETEIDLLLEKIDVLEGQATEDPMTGLLNRRGVMKALKQYSSRAIRYGGEIHLLFVDIDQMKKINSDFGHIYGGDKAITEVAQAINASARKGESIGRIGGDEFLAIAIYEKESPDNQTLTYIIKKRLYNTAKRIHAIAVPIKNPMQGYIKIPIEITVSTHIVNLENPIEDELNAASTKMLGLKH